MKPLPASENALVVRTDFSEDSGWEVVRRAIQKPAFFRANVELISDREYDGLTVENLPALLAGGSPHTFIFLVDRTTISRVDHPILVVALDEEPARSFRVVPSQLWSVENNLSIANMDFEEFVDAVDADGVFRGFPR